MNSNYYYNNYERNISGELISLNDAISLIKKSVSDEKEDELFYDTLMQLAPTEKDKNIIMSIRNDEAKHNRILKDLFYYFTGQALTPDYSTYDMKSNLSYNAGLEKALFGELDAVVKYRKILGAMPNRYSYTLLMSIMTDELKHADKYNFLITQANKNTQ